MQLFCAGYLYCLIILLVDLESDLHLDFQLTVLYLYPMNSMTGLEDYGHLLYYFVLQTSIHLLFRSI